MAGGEIALAYFLDRETAAAPYVTTAGHRLPSRLARAMQDELLRQLVLIWRSLGYRDGPFDCDFVATDEAVFVLDLSPRIGGNSISRLLRVAAGFDLVSYGVRQACGDAAELPRTPAVRPAALTIFGVERAGRLAYDAAVAASLTTEGWVAHIAFDRQEGEPVEAFVNSRHRVGEAVIVGASRAEVDGRAADLSRRLDVRAV
jgi:hypothetical protein